MAAKSGQRQLARPIIVPTLRQFPEADASVQILGGAPHGEKSQCCCATHKGAAMQPRHLQDIVLQRAPTLETLDLPTVSTRARFT
jgi:hypothetical protein